jgi:hypothetical protein
LNDPNWNAKSFFPIVERLRNMGADAELPGASESPDAYTARLLGWMLDVSQPSKKALAQNYWRGSGKPGAPTNPAVLIDHEMAGISITSESNSQIRVTPKSHITEESGRSYRIEGAVQDGKVYKPGEPLPPVATDEDN